MNELARDLRIAMRSLRKRPGFALVAVGTLALGIGANTAIFSVVNTVLLRQLPYPDPERLAVIWGTDARRGDNETRVSYPDFRDWREQSESFEDLAAFFAFPNGDVNLTGGVVPERVPVARVTAGYFELLGVRLGHGRGFLPEENVAGQHRVAVLSHGLWQRQFGSDPTLVGRPVHVNGFPYTVVGILPRDFRPLGTLALGEDVELWRPIAPDDNQTGGRGARSLRVIGRVRSGSSLEAAGEELATIARRLEQEYPDTNVGRGVNLVPLREQVVREVRPALVVLLGAVGLVLLIACTNLANLLLTRAAGRRRELAVRRSLGAPRGRIVRQLLTESVLLSALGGLVGLLFAYGGVRLLIAFGPSDIPLLGDMGIDRTVLLFVGALSLATGLLFGLAPALQATTPNVTESLKEGGRGLGTGPGRRLRRTLVVSELALTFVLLVGAGLLIRSFQQLLAVDPGFDPEKVLTLQLELPMGTKYTQQEQRATFFRSLLERIERHPGVRSASMVNAPPMGEGDFSTSFTVVGGSEDPAAAPAANIQLIEADYFRTMSIPLRARRLFAHRDGPDAPRVAIVNQAAARRWPGAKPLGGRLRLSFGPEAEVVGVVPDVRMAGLDEGTPPIVYLPSDQLTYNFMTVVVRTSTDPSTLIPTIREEVRQLDAEQPIHNVKTMDELISHSVAERRFQMLLLSGFSVLALLLAVVGVYGVISYSISQRTGEIGLRMALGAQIGDILTQLLGEGLRLVVVAMAIAVPAALALTRLMRAFLFGVGTSDLATYSVAALVLVLAAFTAIYIPARRAARVHPMEALRIG